MNIKDCIGAIKGTEGAKTVEPDENYVIPFGKARVVLEADENNIKEGKYWNCYLVEVFIGR